MRVCSRAIWREDDNARVIRVSINRFLVTRRALKVIAVKHETSFHGDAPLAAKETDKSPSEKSTILIRRCIYIRERASERVRHLRGKAGKYRRKKILFNTRVMEVHAYHGLRSSLRAFCQTRSRSSRMARSRVAHLFLSLSLSLFSALVNFPLVFPFLPRRFIKCGNIEAYEKHELRSRLYEVRTKSSSSSRFSAVVHTGARKVDSENWTIRSLFWIKYLLGLMEAPG